MHFGTTASSSTLGIEKNEKNTTKITDTQRVYYCVDDYIEQNSMIWATIVVTCLDVRRLIAERATTQQQQKQHQQQPKREEIEKWLKSANDVLKIDVLFNNIHIFCCCCYPSLTLCVRSDEWSLAKCSLQTMKKRKSILGSQCTFFEMKSGMLLRTCVPQTQTQTHRIQWRTFNRTELQYRNTHVMATITTLAHSTNENIEEKDRRCPAPFNMFSNIQKNSLANSYFGSLHSSTLAERSVRSVDAIGFWHHFYEWCYTTPSMCVRTAVVSTFN